MGIELSEKAVEAQILKTGDDTISVSAGQYLQIRHGTSSSPTIVLEELCPVGKKWQVLLYVSIEETVA